MINIQSTLHTASDLCKNVLLAVLIGSRGDLYTICTQSDMSIYALISHGIETLVGKFETALKVACRTFDSPALDGLLRTLKLGNSVKMCPHGPI